MIRKSAFSLLVCCIALLLISSKGSCAERRTEAQLLGFGKALLMKGAYKEGIVVLEKLKASGCVNAGLYNNLGIGYFKTGETGKAVLCFEQGLLLSPFHTELLRNRNRVLHAAGLSGTPQQAFYRDSGLQSLSNAVLFILMTFVLGYSLVSFLISIAAFLPASCVSRLYFLHHSSFSSLQRFSLHSLLAFPGWVKTSFKIFFILSCLLCIMLTTFHLIEVNRDYGLVVEKNIPVHAGPAISARTAFLIKEGEKVEILKNYRRWYKIINTKGQRGWIQEGSLTLLLR